MNKVLLISLKGCKQCLKVREQLNSSSVNFKEISCDEDPSLCDELEDYTKSSIYPKIIVKSNSTNKSYIYYVSLHHGTLNKEIAIKDNLVLIPAISSDVIITKVKNKVNEI